MWIFLGGRQIIKFKSRLGQVVTAMGRMVGGCNIHGKKVERPRIEGHLRDGMENYCSGNNLKYMKVTFMKSPNIRDQEVLTGLLLRIF